MGKLAEVKMTGFFNSVSGPGWDESHFLTPGGTVFGPTQQAIAIAWANARVLILDGTNCSLFRVRLSVDNINRDRFLLGAGQLPLKFNDKYPGGINAGTTPWIFQSPHLSWVMDMDTDEPGVNPTIYLAGCPMNSTQTGPGPGDMLPPSMRLALNAYGNVLSNGNYGASFRDWPAGAQVPANSVSVIGINWTNAAGGNPAIFTITVTGWGPFTQPVQGDHVRLNGFKYTTPLKRQRYNGTYEVMNSTATTAVLAAPRVTVAPTWGILGYAQVAGQAFTPYTGYALGNITHRKRGRPTISLRGRR